jgi:drug/metabolite transporter (DMT)-like permease
LRYAPFVWARLAHGVLAAVFVLLLWEPLQRVRPDAAAAFAPLFSYGGGLSAGVDGNLLQHFGLQHLPAGAAVFAATLVAIVALYAVYTSVNRLLGRKKRTE